MNPYRPIANPILNSQGFARSFCLAPGARLARLATGGAAMKATAFLEQAKREAQLVDALLVARYALVIHDGMTLLGDD
ncbi:hypothetical protein [Caballeronia sp. ATUFL_M1_KS5A]|uniref:hypothetical protein n=1 Tax=Caballeronia sp. ATUFL_M1_KS5A TaxID=2921778 RepID=UPI0020286476|nr:hypothetical protein [Caballeronia sp. ATUFL_M1_KS5A]